MKIDDVMPLLDSNFLCQQSWFQDRMIVMFKSKEARKLLTDFLKMLQENSLTNHGQLGYEEVCFKDGFFHFIRQASLSILYYNERQKSQKETPLNAKRNSRIPPFGSTSKPTH
ncbi:MAG: hypothetical protein KAI17_03265 [Thiotrichaceae bacterium]|nr:hypothetical protein [Thiotrichaceae bacterium]